MLVIVYDDDDDGDDDDDDAEPKIVVTRRSPVMRHHAREMAFPGGRRDPADSDLWATALREAAEEIELDPAAVERVGSLDSFVTGGSQLLVKPFVAVARSRPDLRVASPREVDAIRHVSLSELVLDEVWREEVWPDYRGMGDRAITFFELVGDTIWGATGSMLRQLLVVALGITDSEHRPT